MCTLALLPNLSEPVNINVILKQDNRTWAITASKIKATVLQANLLRRCQNNVIIQ